MNLRSLEVFYYCSTLLKIIKFTQKNWITWLI